MLPLTEPAAERLEDVTREIEALAAAEASGRIDESGALRLQQLRRAREAMSEARSDRSRVLKD